MLLSNLSNKINVIKTYNSDTNRSFSSITSNSKYTNKNTLFIIDKKTKLKSEYLNEAIKNNIPGILSNKYHKLLKIPQFIVLDLKKETNNLLKQIYSKLPNQSIAITGTNGKTSVVWYITKILNKLNYNNTSAGTLGYFRNGKKINDLSLTTPAFEELYKYGYLKNNTNNIFIFEASSHALDQNRLRHYPVNIAAITNISKDHLDYHKSYQEYKNAKFKLFTKHLKNNGVAIINSRIKNISILKKKLVKQGIKIVYFGKKNIFFKNKKNNYKLIINSHTYNIENLKIKTSIELENLECAIACCLALKINEKKIIKVISNIYNPPGRLQTIKYEKKKSKIVIDYAHTPEALKRILKSLKTKIKKPVLVFGCGGDRDKDKRKSMGIIANKYASKIRKNILKYCPTAIEIARRKDAIKKAIKELCINDILIIAGKGHEQYQIIKNKKYAFDDLKIVKEIINHEN